MLIDSLPSIETLKKGAFFLEMGKPCTKIGQLTKGIIRGFVTDHDGNEITTHFYQEGDMIVGSLFPHVITAMNLQALEACELSVAEYASIMLNVNKDLEVTDIIHKTFGNLNTRLQSRLVALLNMDSTQKYELFLTEYPNLINRIPHYYIANFLGITSTQLSRARKQFINKCK